jgi:hypothetical protein
MGQQARLDEEVSTFLEYSQLVSQGIYKVLAPRGMDATVILLHPLMVNHLAIPNLARRAAHPALVIRIN